MNDRELLELAAKAAGIVINRWTEPDYYSPRRGEVAEVFGQDIYNEWNPLTDDGDAFRLAIKLKFDIEWNGCEVNVDYGFCEFAYDDRCAATRRAIVRAAAEIGKGVK